MDAEGAARRRFGRGWRELEAEADRLIAEGRAAAVSWRWIRNDETLWEMPLTMAGDEAPQRELRTEPDPEERGDTVNLGYDAAGQVVAARYFGDHWEGPDGGHQRGVPSLDAVWCSGALLRFIHRRHGPEHHRVGLAMLVEADRDPDGRLIEVREWHADQDERPWARRGIYTWQDGRVGETELTTYDGALGDGEVRNVTRLLYDYDDAGLLRVRWRVEFDRYFEAGDSGVSWYRRSPKAERQARRLVGEEMPRRIKAWVQRVAPSEPVYGLGLMYSADAPQLPPALGLGTVRELQRWRQAGAARDYIWNPAEFDNFEPLPAELTDDPALTDAFAVLNAAWQAAGSVREPRATLVRCAKQLLTVDWSALVECGEDFVVFVVEDEQGDNLHRQLRATVPSHAVRRLETSA